MKYTSGEWKVRHKVRGSYYIANDKLVIADIADIEDLGSGREESLANACLVAAAPDTHDALIEMLNIFDRNLPDNSIGRRTCDNAYRALDKASHPKGVTADRATVEHNRR